MEDEPNLDPSDLKPGETRPITNFKIHEKEYKNILDRLDVLRMNIGSPAWSERTDVLNKQRDELHTSLGLDRILKIIDMKCSRYLTDMKETGLFLYRGCKSSESQGYDFFMGNSHQDRIPKDSNPEIQQQWDNILSQLGIKAKRSNSIFTSGEPNQAIMYGPKYIIFPFNTANFSWSKTQSDLVLNENTLKQFNKITLSNEQESTIETHLDLITKLESELHHRSLNNILSNREYALLNRYTKLESNMIQLVKDTNQRSIKHVVDTLRAVIFYVSNDGDLVLQLTLILDFMQELLKEPVEFDIKEFQQVYKINDDDFIDALKFKNEICISGHYIAIRGIHESFLRQRYGML